MKVYLLHRDRDVDIKPELRDQIFAAMVGGNLFALDNVKRNLAREWKSNPVPPARSNDDVVTQDLELDTLWSWMAGGDQFLFETARRVVLSGLTEPDEIVYRQRVLADCLEHPEIVGELYRLSIEAIGCDRQVGTLWSGARPGWILHRSVQLLGLYVKILRRLRQIAEQQSEGFRSEGFTRFFEMLRHELSDDYLHTVEQHLDELGSERGVLESAELGKGDKGSRYVFHRPPESRGWKDRIPLVGNKTREYTFELHPRDEAGARALEEIKSQAINHVADAVAQSSDHVRSFFVMLRLELAFYLGCLNLHHHLAEKGEPICLPEPAPEDQLILSARGLYDVCLTMHIANRAIGNEVNADGKSLVILTGANQGGKSTLLRSLGLAQLMMQSGMFVGAEAFHASVSAGVFTHYKREEDATMEGGKLDEELRRMSEIADQIRPRSILLCNESFASTNEREGSEIARQVIRAMLDKQVKVLFVTHMYDLAHSFYKQRLDSALFLRAEREPDGTRTFKLREREPLPTSYGEDSYRRIFGTNGTPAAIAPGADHRGRVTAESAGYAPPHDV